MFQFPKNLYTDVRIETIFTTYIKYTKEDLDEFRIDENEGAFIRIFDGNRWYYSSTTDIGNIQKEIDTLSELATPNKNILEHPIVKKFHICSQKKQIFSENNIIDVPSKQKQERLLSYFPILKNEPLIATWKAIYSDRHIEKKFYSSIHTKLEFDNQACGIGIYIDFAKDEKKFVDSYSKGFNDFESLQTDKGNFKEIIEKGKDFLLHAREIKAGKYKVVLAPPVAGVFAHESFGHKSEADFMLGDEQMKKDWEIGKTVGSNILTIVDDGNEPGIGYTPFDDDGSKAEKTYLIKEGKLSGRLHSATTAAALEEDTTGNARSVSFAYEPIVRMTTTYIDKGKLTKEELFAQIDDGVYVENLRHGSGLSTFTMAPTRCYRIINGKIAYPVKVAVVTGSVFETLGLIDGISDTVELFSFVTGGCGKMEQMPLPVGFGGPYVSVKELSVM